MAKNITVIKANPGDKLFLTRDGVIRQVVYRGVEFTHCSTGAVKNCVILGLSKDELFCCSINNLHADLFYTVEDAARAANSVPLTEMSPELFSNVYMSNVPVNWIGDEPKGYKMNENSKPSLVSPKYIADGRSSSFMGFTSIDGKVTLFHRFDDDVALASLDFTGIYKTEEECVLAYKPKVIMYED